MEPRTPEHGAHTHPPHGVLRSFAGLLLAAAAACSAGPTTVPAPSSDRPLHAIEEARFGEEEGPEGSMFGDVRHLAVSADGTRVVVVDYRIAPQVRMYSAAGNYLGPVGRSGQGPGEYGAFVMGARFLRDGPVAVLDRSNARVLLFGRDRRHLDTIALEFAPNGLEVDRQGDLLLTGADTDRPGAQRLVRWSLHRGPLETVPLPAPEPDPSPTSAALFVLWAPEGELEPFVTRTLSVWSPAGFLVTGRNHRYELTLHTETPLTVRRDLTAPRLTRGEADQWETLSAWTVAARSGEVPALELGSTKPFFRTVTAGRGGRIWVHRYVDAVPDDPIPNVLGTDRPEIDWREPPTWDGYESDGTYLGTVVLPDSFRPLLFREDRVWGVDLDDRLVPRIVRFRLAAGTP